MNNDCAILINSCDKYKDVWNPFFHFFSKSWPNCPYPVFLNTETLDFKYNNPRVNVINTQSNISWSLRLRDVLKIIPHKYVIFMLEDFFLLRPVNQQFISYTLGIMRSESSIAVIEYDYYGNFYPTHSTEFEGLIERDSTIPYFLTCQAALWRKSDLIKLLNPNENPWQYEIYGSMRAKLYNRRFLLMNNPDRPFHYIVKWDIGYGVHGGKWLRANVDLFKKEGLKVDFKRMGFYDGHNVNTTCPPPKKTLNWKFRYFTYGGFDKPYTPMLQQFAILFKSPRKYWAALKRKIKFVLIDSSF